MMADSMQAIERLEAVAEQLMYADYHMQSYIRPDYALEEIVKARDDLQQTIARIHEESEQAARARDAAIKLLVTVRDHKNNLSTPNCPIYQMGKGFRGACTYVIALLEGAEEEPT